MTFPAPHPAAVPVPCRRISGTTTVTTAGMTTTITYDHCMDQTGSSIDGTLRSTHQPSSDPNRTTRDVTFNLTGTRGTRSVTETGGFTTVETLPQSSSDPTELELLGDSFTVAVIFDGKLRDQVTLSSFDIVAFDQPTATVQQVKHFHYDVDRSRLQGRIGVMTTQDVKFGTGADPFTGQILVSGANHTRLQITILGDETFIPPAGQGQVELQIDPGTGTFGAPIWTSWLALSVLSGIGL